MTTCDYFSKHVLPSTTVIIHALVKPGFRDLSRCLLNAAEWFNLLIHTNSIKNKDCCWQWLSYWQPWVVVIFRVWRWLLHKLSKSQSLSTIVLFRTMLTRTIIQCIPPTYEMTPGLKPFTVLKVLEIWWVICFGTVEPLYNSPSDRVQ